MDKLTLIETRDSFKSKVPFQVICDNGYIFTDGAEGSIILWLDDEERYICIRSNPTVLQAEKPFEITHGGYNEIQYIRAYADPDLLKEVITESNHPNAARALEWLLSRDYNFSSNTKGTGDGINWPATGVKNVSVETEEE